LILGLATSAAQAQNAVRRRNARTESFFIAEPEQYSEGAEKCQSWIY
jgi:hypothetical protein